MTGMLACRFPAHGLLACLLLAFLARLITGAQGHWKGCPPSNEQRIYIANHQSHFDLVLIWPYLTWGGAQTHLIGASTHLDPSIRVRALSA